MTSTKRTLLSFLAVSCLCAAPLAAQLEDMTLDFNNVTSTRVNQNVTESNQGNEKEVEFGDYDMDGDIDVVIAIGESDFGQRRNKLYRNDNGILNEVSGNPVIPGFANTDTSRSAFFRDYNDDGYLDIIIINDSNSGTGNNDAPGKTKLYIYDPNNNTFDNVSQNLDNQTGAACNGVSLDFDNNGLDDLLMCNYPNISQDSLSLNGINGNPAGIFDVVTTTNYPSELEYGVHSEGGDMNGDGKIDILMANWTGDPSFIYYNDNMGLGSGPGDFRYNGAAASTVFPQIGGGDERAMIPVDINGDGMLDMYFANHGFSGASRGDLILINTGNDNFNRATFNETIQMPPVHNAETHKITCNDLDGDGTDDLIIMTEFNRPQIYRNLSIPGDVLLINWTTPNITTALEGWQAKSADITANGRPDIFFGSDNDDHLFENVANSITDFDSLTAGLLPAGFHDDAPLAVSGSLEPGESKQLISTDIPLNANVSTIVRSAGDLDVVVMVGATQIASSTREGDGVAEGVEFEKTLAGPVVIEITNPGILLGDINDDGTFDLLDVSPFVNLLSNGDFDPAGDFNGDGSVDLLDVSLFVDALTGGGGSGGSSADFMFEILSQS